MFVPSELATTLLLLLAAMCVQTFGAAYCITAIENDSFYER